MIRSYMTTIRAMCSRFVWLPAAVWGEQKGGRRSRGRRLGRCPHHSLMPSLSLPEGAPPATLVPDGPSSRSSPQEGPALRRTRSGTRSCAAPSMHSCTRAATYKVCVGGRTTGWEGGSRQAVGCKPPLPCDTPHHCTNLHNLCINPIPPHPAHTHPPAAGISPPPQSRLRHGSAAPAPPRPALRPPGRRCSASMARLHTSAAEPCD